MDLQNVYPFSQLLIFSATRLQQDFYELLSDWNEYDLQQPNILKNYIGSVLYGPPKVERNGNLTSVESLFQYNLSQMLKINKLYSKIVEHGTQSANKKILCGLIYNIVFDDESIKTVSNNIHKEYFTADCLMKYVRIVPVFKVLKCSLVTNNEKAEKQFSSLLEIYYIDNNERVYKSWNDYLKNNILLPCTMVVPYGGEYQVDESKQWSKEMSNVWVEVHDSSASPAYNKQTITNTEISFLIAGWGGIALCAASLFPPFTPITLAGGLGLFTLSQGMNHQIMIAQTLTDRPIFPLSNEPSEEKFLLKHCLFMDKTFELVYNGAVINPATATGITAGLSIYNKYEQSVSRQEIFKLAVNLLILGNSTNFQWLSTIIQSNQSSIIKNYELSLRSNRHRMAYKNMINNTKSQKEQIICKINKIVNIDDFFATIDRNTNNFTDEKIELAFANGKVIDGKTLMSSIDFVKSTSTTSVFKNMKIINPVLSTSATISNKSAFQNVLSQFLNELTGIVIPKLKDFFHVLTEINKFDKPIVIFSKLLILALKIMKLFRENYSASIIPVLAVDFLWNYIKTIIRESSHELDDADGWKIVKKVLIQLHDLFEETLDEWVTFFKEYLELKGKKIEGTVNDLCKSQFKRINIFSRSLLSNGVIS